MTDNATFFVPDMTCGHCEKAVRGALSAGLPQALVAVDLASQKVSVGGDAGVAEAAIRAAGYDPELLAG